MRDPIGYRGWFHGSDPWEGGASGWVRADLVPGTGRCGGPVLRPLLPGGRGDYRAVMKRIELRRESAGAAFVLVAALVLLGPRATVREELHPVDVAGDVDAWLAASEATVPHLRAGDQKEVVWVDSAGRKTPFVVVYLHGFSADRHEIAPVPRLLADSLGANLFYTRFRGHGRDGAAMGEIEANDWLQDVVEALAVARRLGDRIVLVGTSTGGTLATWAAARPELAEDVAALLLVSPNFYPRDPTSRLLLWPWGGRLAELIVGPERCWEAYNEAQARHWTTCYPTRALLPMMGLVERVRTMDLSEVRVPALILYSPGDQVVDPGATQARSGRLGSVPKLLLPFAASADPSQHILAGNIMSPGTNDEVLVHMLTFLRDLGIP